MQGKVDPGQSGMGAPSGLTGIDGHTHPELFVASFSIELAYSSFRSPRSLSIQLRSDCGLVELGRPGAMNRGWSFIVEPIRFNRGPSVEAWPSKRRLVFQWFAAGLPDCRHSHVKQAC